MNDAEARTIGRAIINVALSDRREGVTLVKRCEDAAAWVLMHIATERPGLFPSEALEHITRRGHQHDDYRQAETRAQTPRTRKCPRCGLRYEA